MTRIDRYILFLYFRILILCFSSIVGLLIIVEVFTNLEEFMLSGKQQGSIIKVLVDYFGPRSLSIFEYISGLLAMMAMMFVISWLYRTNELTALLAAGVTKRRVIRPLLIASGVVILLAVFAREVGVPRYQDKLGRQPQDLTAERPQPVRPASDHKAGVLIDGRGLLAMKRQLLDPNIRCSKPPLFSVIGKRLQAQTATFLSATNEHPQGYLLSGVTIPAAIDSLGSIDAADGQPVLCTNRDHLWVGSGNCFLVSNLDFDALRGGSNRFASTSELISHLRSADSFREDLQVTIHSRILRPLIDWTVVLLGIPIVLSRPDRNVFWVAGTCLTLVAGFTAIVLGLNAAGSAGYLVSPFLAVWLPIVVALPWSATRMAASCER